MSAEPRTLTVLHARLVHATEAAGMERLYHDTRAADCLELAARCDDAERPYRDLALVLVRRAARTNADAARAVLIMERREVLDRQQRQHHDRAAGFVAIAQQLIRPLMAAIDALRAALVGAIWGDGHQRRKAS